MFFKFTARNAYRDLIRNARRVLTSDLSESEKSAAFQELYTLLQPKLHENERCILSSPAFAKRCVHWNQLDISSIRPVKQPKNPWLIFKREFESALKLQGSVRATAVSRALMWFSLREHKDDWLAD